MAIVGEKLRDYVINQIEARQKKLSPSYQKTDTDLVYFNSKTSWIKMASGVSINEDKLREIGLGKDIKKLSGTGLAKKHILFGGTAAHDGDGKSLLVKDGFGSNFDNTKGFDFSTYDISQPFGIVPNPGIKDMSLKCLNRGSLKRAKIKIRVENKFQLQVIDVLYLRLGYTLLLEWGNSHYINKNGEIKNTPLTLIEKEFFKKSEDDESGPVDFTTFLNKIENLRKETQGNYDGFLGKVSNFDWSFNEDGSYDVNLDLISLGDVIESLKSNVTLDPTTSDYILDSTSGSSNLVITSKDDPVNENRTVNSLFSILYLWKDQYKTALNIFQNHDSPYYNSANAIRIEYSTDRFSTNLERIFQIYDPVTGQAINPATGEAVTYAPLTPINQSKTIAYVGDCLTPPKEDELEFTIGDFELKLDIGFLDVNAATKGSPNTYHLKKRSTGYDDGYNNGRYGHYYYQAASRSNTHGYTSLTIKGKSSTTNKLEIINSIINAGTLENAQNTLGYTFTKSSTSSPFDFESLKFWLAYYKSDAQGNSTREWSDSFPLTQDDKSDTRFNTSPLAQYKLLTSYLTHTILNFGGRSGGYRFLIAQRSVYPDNLKLGYGGYKKPRIGAGRYQQLESKFNESNTPVTNYTNLHNRFWWHYNHPQNNVYPIGQGGKTFKTTVYSPTNIGTQPYYKKGGETKSAFGGYTFDRWRYNTTNYVGYKDMSSVFNGDERFNPDKNVPFKARVDIPFVRVNITNSNQKKTTAANPLKKFNDNDVCRLYTKTSQGQFTYKFYMKFGALLHTLKNEIITKVDLGKKDDNPNIVLINNESNANDDNFVSYMVNKPNLTSFDIDKCFVTSTVGFNSSTASETFDLFQSFTSQLDKWEINDKEANSMNIYLSFKFIGESLSSNTDKEGNVSLYSFIKSICDGINRSFANVPNLEPVVNETTNELSIVDSSINKSENDGSYSLNPYSFLKSKGCFVRKLDLKTAITPQYATMVTVGATAGGYVKGVEATAFANWNRGLTDRYKPALTPANTKNKDPKNAKVDQIKEAIEEFQKMWAVDRKAMLTPLGSSTDPFQGIDTRYSTENSFVTDITTDKKRIESNKQIADEYFRAYQSQQSDGSSLGFIPFNVSLKMDGISGIKIYNEILLDVDFLPANYPSGLSFIVTAVDHNLRGNDWETTLKLTLIPLIEKSVTYKTPELQNFTKRYKNSINNDVDDNLNGVTPGTGYPPSARSTKFINEKLGGISPVLLHTDGSYVIRKFPEGVTSIEQSKSTPGGLKKRHWFKTNPSYTATLVKVNVPLKTGDVVKSVHPKFAAALEKAFADIRAQGLQKYLFHCGGIFAIRNVTDGTSLTNHAYGLAIDLNNTKPAYKFGSKWDVANKKITQSDGSTIPWTTEHDGYVKIVNIMKSYGIGWLGHKDPMHFSIFEISGFNGLS